MNRHITRICVACRAPAARQEDDCWRCGAFVVLVDDPLWSSAEFKGCIVHDGIFVR